MADEVGQAPLKAVVVLTSATFPADADREREAEERSAAGEIIEPITVLPVWVNCTSK